MGSPTNHWSVQVQTPAALNPTVIIGMGGTGKDVLARTRRLLVERFGALSNVPVVQFVSIDTDDAPPGVPEIFMGQNIAFRHDEKAVLDTTGLGPILGNLAQYEHLAEWFPPDLAGVQDLTSGAKQIRALGRLAFFMGYAGVRDVVTAAVKGVTDRDKARFMLDHYGLNVGSGVDVYIVSSLCGGTGSGMLLDVAYGIRKWFRDNGLVNEVNAYVMLPGAFTGVSDRVKANGYACLKELNHHMGLGRAEGARFKARYSHSPLDAIDEKGPPFDFCYLIGDQNKAVDAARLTDLQEMIAQKLTLEVSSPFARYAKSNRSNLEGVWQVTPRDPFGQPQNYLAFGLASLRFPADRVAQALGARLAGDLVARWRRTSGDAGGSAADFEKVLAKQKWLEISGKTHFADALRALPSGGTFGDELDRWVEKVKENINERTRQYSTDLTDVDQMLWEHHRGMRERTRAAGADTQHWGDLAQALLDNVKRVETETRAGLEKAVAEACDDPARGPRYARWLLDELRGAFERNRETYLGLAKHLASESPKEKDLKQALSRLDPLAETLWLKLTLQMKGKLSAEVETTLKLFHRYHLAQLEDKLREMGGGMFGRLLEAIAAQRTKVEKLEQALATIAGELRSREKDAVAEILALNYAHTIYLFESGDVEAYFSERFADPEVEKAVLAQLSRDVLPAGLVSLPDLSDEEARKPFLDKLVTASRDAFDAGDHPFKLNATTVAERFVAKYPDRKRQEAVLLDLSNHANPFIHLDGKQAAHKFVTTPIQKVVGLADADSAHPPRAVKEVLEALAGACQVGPGQIKPNPDNQALMMVQEFGAFPLRVIKGLEGYKACYLHYVDRHLHITKHQDTFPDLFPPDEAKAAEALRALTLGMALKLVEVDTADGRTMLYRFRDAAGLPDELALGGDEQAGVAALVDHDDARARLLQQADEVGKHTAGPDARRALYDTLVLHARSVEAKLGARHPRYQVQRAVLGDFIRTYLAAGVDASATVPAASPAGEAIK